MSVVGISLTGVMMPGPVTAATIAKGYGDRNAGALIAIGHAVIEMPLIAAIYLGFGHFISSPQVVRTIHIVGALMLFYLGFRMFRTATSVPGRIGGLPVSSLITGIVLTGTNPGFYVWWMTIGIALIVGATDFGLSGILLFAVVHWLCDLAYYEFLSMATFKSRKWWTQKVQRIVFSACASMLIGFGIWFVYQAFV
ncbi:MAG: LysE family transporter [Dehalococcoidia bacterium]|nr:LysE family transporter [Dehalococcoidia bacterium]